MQSPTADKRVLLATQGFAALGLVTADYVLPKQFLPIDGGNLNYAGVDAVTYASLPTDGVSAINRLVGWQFGLLAFPIVYWIYRSYQTYLSRLAAQKKHAEEIAALHLRTIEALSLAIEAKDHTTHDHLRRVQVYAVEIAKDLGLDESQLNAIRAEKVLGY